MDLILLYQATGYRNKFTNIYGDCKEYFRANIYFTWLLLY